LPLYTKVLIHQPHITRLQRIVLYGMHCISEKKRHPFFVIAYLCQMSPDFAFTWQKHTQ